MIRTALFNFFGSTFLTAMTVTLDSALSRKDRDRRDDTRVTLLTALRTFLADMLKGFFVCADYA